jgi:hypothetical protein
MGLRALLHSFFYVVTFLSCQLVESQEAHATFGGVCVHVISTIKHELECRQNFLSTLLTIVEFD